MDVIKIEVDEDYLSCENSCFICLEPVGQINKGQFNLVNLFFNYLKISERENAVVCEKCEEKLIRFGELCNILEKVKLEMDYLLRYVKSAITNSNNDLDPADAGITSVRESVVKKCQEEISNPKPEIVLQRIDLSKLIKHESPALDCSDECSPSLTDESGYSERTTSVKDFGIGENIKVIIAAGEAIKFPKRPNILSHKRTLKTAMKDAHLQINLLKCSKCNKIFGEQKDFKSHDCVPRQPKPFKCSKCNKEYDNLITLRDHISAQHLHLKPHKCDMCDQSFARFHDLRRHKTKHDSGEIKMHSLHCEFCEKEFGDLYSLNMHMQKAHPDARFPCGDCKKVFKSRHNLNRHISDYHDKEERFNCEVPGCGKSYNYRGVLDVHYRLKHPDFPAPTPIQMPDFTPPVPQPKPKFRKPTSSAGFLQYCRNGERVVECERCGCKFSSLDQVISHIKMVHEKDNRIFKIVHESKAFVCSDCGYKTDDKYYFDLHAKLIHKRGKKESVEPEFILP